MLLTISNLFPRPDQPYRGLFNVRLFAALNELAGVENVCPVPCVNPMRRAAIRRWADPSGSPFPTTYVPVSHMPFFGRNRSWRHTLSALRRVPKPAGIEAVFAAWLYPDGVAALTLAQEWNVPGWVLVQGSDTFHLAHPIRRRAILDACSKAAGIVCVWSGLKDRLVTAGVDPTKIHVIPNGVDAGLFRPRPREEAWRELGRVSGARCQVGGRLLGCRVVRLLGRGHGSLPVKDGEHLNKELSLNSATQQPSNPTTRPADAKAVAEESGRWEVEGGEGEREEGCRRKEVGGEPEARSREAANRSIRNGSSAQQLSNSAIANFPRIVLFVGNLVHVKGPDVLLEAWARVRGRKSGMWEVGSGKWEVEGEGGEGERDCGKWEVEGEGGESGGGCDPLVTSHVPHPTSHVPPSTCHQSPVTSHLSPVTYPSPLLVFIGDGPMRKGLERQARRLGIRDSVVFLGSRPPEEVALWMNVAACLCLPSRNEGCPNVVLEAMASGLPVVATDVGACRELLQADAASRVIPAGEPRDCAEAIRRMLEVGMPGPGIARERAMSNGWNGQASRIWTLMSDPGVRADGPGHGAAAVVRPGSPSS